MPGCKLECAYRVVACKAGAYCDVILTFAAQSGRDRHWWSMHKRGAYASCAA